MFISALNYNLLTPAASCPSQKFGGFRVPDELLEPLPAGLLHRLLGERELGGCCGLGVLGVGTAGHLD